jgi:hypothetical protein
MIELSKLSAAQLKRAVAIKEQIEALESQLNEIFGESASSNGVTLPASQAPAKRAVSAAARARMAAAQKARWANVRGPAPKPLSQPKRRMSPAARARIAAAARARWAKARAAGRNAL